MFVVVFDDIYARDIPHKLQQCGYGGRMPGGRPREYDEDRITKAVRIPKQLDERLKGAARDRQVSANLIFNAALEEYLGRLRPVDEVLQTG